MSPNLLEIERSIRDLSLEEQLWLLERIARQIRRTSTDAQLVNAKDLEETLVMMASDPEILADYNHIPAIAAVIKQAPEKD